MINDYLVYNMEKKKKQEMLTVVKSEGPLPNRLLVLAALNRFPEKAGVLDGCCVNAGDD